MAIFPRPASPRNASGDLWNYLKESRAHKWPLLALSMVFTWLIVWAFLVDSNTNTTPRQNKIIYFESWNTPQSDVEIILEQKRNLALREAALRKKQKEMQRLADKVGIEWREDAKRNEARRTEALKYINTMLDKRLAEARSREKSATIGKHAASVHQ